jgi:hydroxymethylpyrimidine/phosphomethylpyrimidine kinase
VTAALTIAGSDPSGGAGIQADLKSFHQFGVYGQAVVTLITVQNSVRVSRVEIMSADLVAAQIAAVVEDMPPAAAKTGALGSAAVVETIAELASFFKFPLVVDPVMISKHGRPLLAPDAWTILRDRLLPAAALVTPNLPEAEALTGMTIRTPDDLRRGACQLHKLGARAVLIKGGHREGSAVDLLFDGAEWHEFGSARYPTPHTHGTGCTYSAAITAGLACGLPLVDAISRAKRYVSEAIRTNPGLGQGAGPLNHFAEAS